MSRQAGGSGIGLSLVKVMNEPITVDIEAGKGSVFTMMLPVTKISHKVEEFYYG